MAAGDDYIAQLEAARDYVRTHGKLDAKGRELYKQLNRFITLAGAAVP